MKDEKYKKSNQLTVLYLDSHIDHAVMAEKSFKEQGLSVSVIHADSIIAAYEITDSADIDLIVSEYVIEEGTALDILSFLRERGRNIPVIVVTGQGSEKIASRVFHMGAYDYIVKKAEGLHFKRLANSVHRLWEAEREKRMREATELKYRFLVENLRTGVLLIRDYRVEFANSYFLEMLGYDRAELKNMRFTDFLVPEQRAYVKGIYEARIGGLEAPERYEVRAIKKDSTEITLEVNPSLIHDENGPASLVLLKNITEMSREETRRASFENMFRLIFDTVSDAVFVHDTDGNIIDANSGSVQITGYPIDELKVMNIRDFLIPTDRDMASQELLRLESSEKRSFIVTAYRKDGTTRTALVRAESYIIDGEALIISIVRTEKDHSVKNEVFASDNWFEEVVEAVPALILGIDENHNTVYINKYAEMITGYLREEVIGKNYYENFIAPEDRERVKNEVMRDMEGGQSAGFVNRIVTRFGEKRTISWNSANVTDSRGVKAVLGIGVDVSKAVDAEDSLRKTEKKYKELFDSARDIIIVISQERRILEANMSACEALGYSRGELVGRSIMEIIVTKENGFISEKARELLFTNGASFEADLCTAGGTIIPAEANTVIIDMEGKPASLTVFRDLRERRKTIEAEARFRAAVENAEIVAAQGYDASGIIVSWNRASEVLFGFKEETALGKTLGELILSEENAKGFESDIAYVFKTGKPVMPREWKTTDSNGIEKWIFSTMLPVTEGSKCLEAFCVMLDITSRKELEFQLAKRNEELETFAHSVSHDLRSPLVTLDGYVQLVIENARELLAEEQIGYLAKVLEVSRRMERMIDALLDYGSAGASAGSKDFVDIEKTAAEIWMERQSIADKSKAELRFDLDESKVFIYPFRLKQVLANLIENALKFLGEGNDKFVEVGSFRSSNETVIFVRDNGIGIDESDKETIFEPFKKFAASREKGLGIGLSTAKRAVDHWNGIIWVESTKGRGATFFFTIPEEKTANKQTQNI